VTERRAPWQVSGLRQPLPLSPDLQAAIDGMVAERDCDPCALPLPNTSAQASPAATIGSGAGAPMLDPAWSPARGYAHAAGLLEILQRTDNERGTK
jgi:hypothetical protein